jgi:histidyl-tRNA synthetase
MTEPRRPDTGEPPASTQPARGTRDFLPDDVRRREFVVRHVRAVYERYGFEPLETPAIENIETLLGKYGEEGNRLIFKILRRGEREASGEADLALRYDLTVPLARVVARYRGDLPKFFKRYQIQPVWRADRPARARFREFYQCDIDTVGSSSPLVEAEQIAAVSDVLKMLGFADFAIRLNHRGVLAGLLESSGIDPARHVDALVALDKRDKIGEEGVLREMIARGIDEHAALRGLRLVQPAGGDADRLPPTEAIQAMALRGLNATSAHREALEALEQIARMTEDTAAAGHVVFDPSLARGLSYYTGAIMEIAVPDLAGSLGGGGRYDELVGMFLGQRLPACGFSLGLERIIVVMAERSMFPAEISRSAVDVLVTFWNDAAAGETLALASELRAGGLRVDVYPEADRLGKQFRYASSRNVPLVAVLGDDERARNEVAVKDLRTGAQTAVARAEVVGFVRQQLRT